MWLTVLATKIGPQLGQDVDHLLKEEWTHLQDSPSVCNVKQLQVRTKTVKYLFRPASSMLQCSGTLSRWECSKIWVFTAQGVPSILSFCLMLINGRDLEAIILLNSMSSLGRDGNSLDALLLNSMDADRIIRIPTYVQTHKQPAPETPTARRTSLTTVQDTHYTILTPIRNVSVPREKVGKYLWCLHKDISSAIFYRTIPPHPLQYNTHC